MWQELRSALPKDQIPDAKFFWSMTMYTLSERLLVENPIDMGLEAGHPLLKTNADGLG